MKDEEMAEEWWNNWSVKDWNDIKEGKRLFIQAFLAGRPQWHDLRKEQNDLPKPTTPVLVILESGVPYVSWISSDKKWWFCTNYYTGEDKVIAWCEIPTFDKE